MKLDLQKMYLLLAVVQAQDAETAEIALTDLGVSINRLPSIGGFLGRRNASLLMGLSNQKIPEAVHLLDKNCRKRIEYVTVPVESAPLPMPTPTPVTIGGVTLFTIKVEHYEEI